MTFSKYDIMEARLHGGPAGSSVQRGIRPVIIVSNNACNTYSPVVSVIPITSKSKRPLPTHVTLEGFGLRDRSTALCEQITSIDKTQMISRIGHVDDFDTQEALQRAIIIQVAS